jgi:hypothetical protein
MRHSKHILLAASLGVALAGGGLGLAEATSSSSTAAAATAPKAATAPAGSATVNLATATVGGKSEQVLVDSNGQQVLYNGHFLYTFADDTPGQVTGQGVQGFSVATPGLAAGSASTPASSVPRSNTNGNSYGYGY